MTSPPCACPPPPKCSQSCRRNLCKNRPSPAQHPCPQGRARGQPGPVFGEMDWEGSPGLLGGRGRGGGGERCLALRCLGSVTGCHASQHVLPPHLESDILTPPPPDTSPGCPPGRITHSPEQAGATVQLGGNPGVQALSPRTLTPRFPHSTPISGEGPRGSVSF